MTKDLYPRIGALLRKLRLEHGKSQSEVAALIGVSYQQVHKYETGFNQIPFHNLVALSKLYRISLDFVMDELNELPPQDLQTAVTSIATRRNINALRLFTGLERSAQDAITALMKALSKEEE